MLEPITVTRPFELVGVDIKGPYKASVKGNKYILVCIDYFTNWVEAAPMKTITGREVIDKFFELIISRHGSPEKLITDQGTQFTSKLFETLCHNFNIEKMETTAYHPQCNGKVEKFNKFLNDSVATSVNEDHSNWDRLIDSVLLTYRSS